MINNRIRVLVVDDSSVFRLFLTYVLNSDPAIEVVGMAHDGIEALEKVQILKPDLITIDVNMPRLGGFEATERIMQIHPVPIIIVSGNYNTSEASMTFNALKSGAVTILPKPEGIGHPKHNETVAYFLRMVRTMAEVKVVRRHSGMYTSSNSASQLAPVTEKKTEINSDVRLVVIGSSAGGPPVLQEILTGLGPNFSLPVIIVQHIDSGFAQGLAEWLSQTTSQKVIIASSGELLRAGHFYMAPADHHISIAANGQLVINQDPHEHSCRPSVSYLFRSARKMYGRYALGIILTGMGRDGALELREMRELGSITIAQDPSTVLVNGMPGEAVRLGAATHILSPAEIIQFLRQLVRK